MSTVVVVETARREMIAISAISRARCLTTRVLSRFETRQVSKRVSRRDVSK